MSICREFRSRGLSSPIFYLVLIDIDVLDLNKQKPGLEPRE